MSHRDALFLIHLALTKVRSQPILFVHFFLQMTYVFFPFIF